MDSRILNRNFVHHLHYLLVDRRLNFLQYWMQSSSDTLHFFVSCTTYFVVALLVTIAGWCNAHLHCTQGALDITARSWLSVYWTWFCSKAVLV